MIPIRQLGTAMRQARPEVVLASLAFLVAGHVAAGLKWQLLQGGSTGLGTLSTLRAHFSGLLANLWLPSVVGGDVVRAGVVLRRSAHPAMVALASLVDRIIDSIVLLVLATAGLVLVGAPAQNARAILLAITVSMVISGVLIYGIFAFMKRRSRSAWMGQLVDAVRLTAERPGLVLMAFGVSLAIQTAFILVNANLGRAVGMHAPTAAWFLTWPLAKLVALAPFSAAGIGVREAALVVLMRPFGDPPSAIMAAGLLWQGIYLAGGTLGWAALSIMPDNKKR